LIAGKLNHQLKLLTKNNWVEFKNNDHIYMEESKLKLQGTLDEVMQIDGEHLRFLN
jgi:DUF1365 family protein